MSVTCDEAGAFLIGDLCHRIAVRLARDVPGVEADDLIHTAYADFVASRRRRCPHWHDCPLNGGDCGAFLPTDAIVLAR